MLSVIPVALFREICRQIIDDLIEFVVCAVRAFVRHIAHYLLPPVTRLMTAKDDLWRMTAAADLLHGGLPGAIRQLRPALSRQGAAPRKRT